MIKFSVLYPNEAGKRFDMAYYCNNHLPLIRQRLGAACRRIVVEQGVSGKDPDAAATYIAIGHLYFDSVEAFHAAFDPHAAELTGNIPNYTDIKPIFQISEVIME